MPQPSRIPLIAGNWKMNLDLKGSVELIRALAAALPRPYAGPGAGLPGPEAGRSRPEILVAPPFTALSVAAEALKGSPIRLGAQDMHWEASGAFTGEVSAAMLKDAGCSHVILGHSERRRYFGETDASVRRKLAAALKGGLIPLVCIGETLEERESRSTWQVLKTQLEGGLQGFAPVDLAALVLAYEPVWAIGTGRNATPAQAVEAHAFVRSTVAGLYGDGLAAGLRILYGGSVTPENIDALMAEPEVDGALVGGASLKAAGFARIIAYRAGESGRARGAGSGAPR